MPPARLQYGAPEQDANLLYATRFPAPDPVFLLERGGRSTLVVRDLELGRARAQAEVSDVLGFRDIEDYEWVEARANTTGAAPVTFRFAVRVEVPPGGGARQLRFDYRGWALFPNGVFVRSPADDRYGKGYVVGGASSGPTSAWCQANALSRTLEWNCGATGKQCCTNPPGTCPESGVCSVTAENPQGLCVNPTTCFNNQPCLTGQVCCIVGAAQTACVAQAQCAQVASCSPVCQISQFCDARGLPASCKECSSLEEAAGQCENCGNENELCCGGSACNTGLACGGFVREKPCGSDPAKPLLLGWKWTNLAAGEGETYSTCGDVIVGVGSDGKGSSSTAVLPDPSCATITGEQYLDSENRILPTGCFTRDATGFIRYNRQTGCEFDLSGTKTATVRLLAACFNAVPRKPSVRVTLASSNYAQQLLQGQTIYREARSSAGGLCVNAAQRWTQKLNIRVQNPSGQTLYNYPVQLKFDGAGPIARGELQVDGRDLRLASTSGFQREFPFWVDGSLNTNNAKLWFRLDELGPGQTRDLALFYGNAQAAVGPRLSTISIHPSSDNNHWVLPGPGGDWSMAESTGQTWRITVPTGIATLTSAGNLYVDKGAYAWALSSSAGRNLLAVATASRVAASCTVTDASLCGTTCNNCLLSGQYYYGSTCVQQRTLGGGCPEVVICPYYLSNQYLNEGKCVQKYGYNYCLGGFGDLSYYECTACPPCTATTNTCTVTNMEKCGFTEAAVTLDYQTQNNLGGSRTATYSLEFVSPCAHIPCTSTARATLTSATLRIQNPVLVYVNDVLITDTTPPPVLQDTTPPELTSLEADSNTLTGTSILVKWVTNEGSSSQVLYGKTTSLGSQTPADATPVLLHQVMLTGLSPGTTYYARARSCDSSGNCALSANFVTFATPPDTPPTVTLVDPLPDSVENETPTVFRFKPSDDKGFSKAEVWTNSTGSWAVSGTKTSGLYNNEEAALNVTFTANGVILWNVRICDNADQCAFAPQNRTFTLDVPALATPTPTPTPSPSPSP